MQRTLVWLVVAALLFGACTAESDQADAAPPAIDVVAPAPELTAAVEQVAGEEGVAAASVAVRLPDGRVWLGTTGNPTAQRRRAVTTDTPFRLASITKTYVAALALLLVDDGVLQLDAPVHLDGVPRAATLRQLLSHTSGLPHDYELPERPWTEARLADLRPEAVCEPGTCVEYSDLGFIAAGLLIERETGQSLEDLLRRRVFEPLGLEHTWFAAGDPPAGTADLHREDGGRTEADFTRQFGNTWAGGAMVATASDLLAWGEALLSGHILPDALLHQMTAATASYDLPCARACAAPYGLGLALGNIHGRPARAHGGSTGTILVHLPDEQLTVAVLTNRPRAELPVLDRVLDVLDVADRADVHVLDVETGDHTRLTTDPAVDGAPAWMPDGRVVFGSTRDGNPELYVMNDDGSEQRRLTDHPADDVGASVGPEGTVVFTTDRNASLDIWSVGPDGSDLGALIAGPLDQAWAHASPTDGRVVYEHAPTTTTWAIAVAAPDGRDPVSLPLPGNPGHPAWSPNGDRIVYVDMGKGIRTARPDGTDVTVVSTGGGDRAPAWGPDNRIAFVSGHDLWLVNLDGSGRRRLTDTDAWEFLPAWSPDGTSLLYVSDGS